MNGRAEVQLASAYDFQVLGQTAHHADFLVAPHNLGAGVDGFLGENLLSLSDAEFDLANGVIRFWDAKDCRGANLAYWVTANQTYSELPIDRINPPQNKIMGWAKVNGVRLRVVFDTGAGESMLDAGAARRAGLTVDGPDVLAAGQTGGIGDRRVDSWLSPIKTFDLGDEHVANTHLRFGRVEVPDADMLIGADWFLAHRVFVSKSLNTMFFSYNGGPVFLADKAAALAALAPGSAPTAAAAAPPSFPSNEPTDAAGFSRRGDAFIERDDFASAIADFGRAIDLEPNEPRHYVDRARALLRDHQTTLVMSDFDRAIRLKPDDVETLLSRGELRLSAKDDTGAAADFDAAIKADPQARFTVAGAYSGMRRYNQALVQLDQWLDAYPKDEKRAAALNNRCWARAMLDYDLDKALIDCNEAVKLEGDEIQFLDSRGMVHLRLGQLDQSIADYNAVLKRQKIAWSFYGRGLAEEKRGLKAQGDADIAAATALDPKISDEAKSFGLTP